MAKSSPQALPFTVRALPNGDLNHFVVDAIVPAVRLRPGGQQKARTERAGSAAAAADSPAIAPRVEEQTGPGVIAKYRSIPGNQPATYRNTVALWNSLLPNLGTTPLQTANIPTDNQVGEALLDYPLGPTDYCVTYQVSEDVKTMCALAQLRLAGNAIALPTYVSIEIKSVTTDAITVLYNTLPGYRPATYKNWLGLWPGFALPYDGLPPLSQATVNADYTQGLITLPFSRIGQDYTIVYFTGQAMTCAAAMLYFDVGPPQPISRLASKSGF